MISKDREIIFLAVTPILQSAIGRYSIDELYDMTPREIVVEMVTHANKNEIQNGLDEPVQNK